MASFRVAPPAIRSGVALTFDDGPDRRFTPALLEVLARAGAPATFFLTGSQVPGCEDLVRRIVEQGHRIGTHGMDHVDFTTLRPDEVRSQLQVSRDLLTEVSGEVVTLFRPPYGRVDEVVLSASAELDLDLVLWSVEGGDWEPVSPEVVAYRALEVVRDGDVLLLHDGRKDHLDTAATTALLLDGLARSGLQVVELDALYP